MTSPIVKTKTKVHTKLKGEAEGHSRTLLRCRDLIDVSDEPIERGGTNEGLAPTEMALGALIACTNVITHKIAAKHNIVIDDASFDLDAEFNRLGVTLQEEVLVPFPEIVLDINLTTSASDQEIDVLKTELDKFCPVAKVFSAAGSKIINRWHITRPN